MKQIFLALDWSNLAFRSLFMQRLGNNGTLTYDERSDVDAYIAKLATDVAYIVRIFNPTKVIFTADSKHSWRKDILETYKSNRERDKDMNWDNIFAGLDEFKEHLKSIGYIFLETENAEADDLMAMAKEVIFEDTALANTNLILVSADADIRQLIDFKDYSKQYCIVFNEIGRGPGGKRHLYTNSDIQRWFDSQDNVVNDIFSFGEVDSDKAYLRNILDMNQKIAIEETDPKNILLSKVFCGDDGDAVPAFYDWFSNKGKKVRVTNSKFVKILEKLDADDIETIDAKKKQLKPVLEAVCNRQINDIDVEERLMRQKKLVQLKSIYFPEHIQEYKSKIRDMLVNEGNVDCYNLTMKDLIKDSPFDSVLKAKRHKDANIFKGLDSYIDNLNLTQLF